MRTALWEERLEAEGIVFDIIDEELVEKGTVVNGTLHCGLVSYESVFVPELVFEAGISLEPSAVCEKLRQTGKAKLPCIGRTSRELTSRKLIFKDGSEGYFICNCGGELLEETIVIESEKEPYLIDLYDGSLQMPAYTRKENTIQLDIAMLRGEGLMVWLTEEKQEVAEQCELITAAELADVTSYISRSYRLDPERGICNEYGRPGEEKQGLWEWPADFSGEVTYTAVLPQLPQDAVLDLGEVRHFAKVFINDRKLGEVTMPPYRIPLTGCQAGEKLKIVVANTIANVCHDAEYFNRQHPADVGPYHANMIRHEALAPAGGLLGPVRILQKREK